MKTAASNKIPTRKASDIDEIIIHCSATPAGMNFNADDIDRWHKAQGYRPGAPRFPSCRRVVSFPFVALPRPFRRPRGRAAELPPRNRPAGQTFGPIVKFSHRGLEGFGNLL